MDAQKKKFTEHIKSLIPISDLAPEYQNEVVQQAEILKFKKKQRVFKQGDVDAYTYYLLDGEPNNRCASLRAVSGVHGAPCWPMLYQRWWPWHRYLRT